MMREMDKDKRSKDMIDAYMKVMGGDSGWDGKYVIGTEVFYGIDIL